MAYYLMAIQLFGILYISKCSGESNKQYYSTIDIKIYLVLWQKT